MATQTLIKPIEVVTDGIVRPAAFNTNFDQNLISPFVALAEENNTLRILGSDLYEDMIAQQNAAASNYNPDAGALVDKFPTNAVYETFWVKYLLRYEGLIVYNTALPYIQNRLTSQGIILNNPEYGENAGLQTMKFMQDTNQRHIDNLEILIKDYLCDNKADFPLYDSDKNCPCSDNVDCSCDCGYYETYGKSCPNCKTGRNTSTKIIFY